MTTYHLSFLDNTWMLYAENEKHKICIKKAKTLQAALACLAYCYVSTGLQLIMNLILIFLNMMIRYKQ